MKINLYSLCGTRLHKNQSNPKVELILITKQKPQKVLSPVFTKVGSHIRCNWTTYKDQEIENLLE